MLKKYNDLGTVHRTAPCLEYPGMWIINIPGYLDSDWSRFWRSEERESLGHSHPSFEVALQKAKEFLSYLERCKVEYDPRDIMISWKCSDNDVRIGKIWFTPFYTHGRFNYWGIYTQTLER